MSGIEMSSPHKKWYRFLLYGVMLSCWVELRADVFKAAVPTIEVRDRYTVGIKLNVVGLVRLLAVDMRSNEIVESSASRSVLFYN